MSTWEEVIPGVSKAQYWDPYFLMDDIFYFDKRSFLNYYADDNLLYHFCSNPEEIKENLNEVLFKSSDCFHENCMILNSEKRHYMCLGKDAVSD